MSQIIADNFFHDTLILRFFRVLLMNIEAEGQS